jgi:hypothetical protein
MEWSFFNNTCIGHQIFVMLNETEYNNPFIGSLIVNDHQFIKLCGNLKRYLSIEPIFGTPSSDSKWSKHGTSRIQNMGNYPVMYIDDIEIHWIHEETESVLLEKYNRRRNRYLNGNFKNLCILSYSQLLNNNSTTELNELLINFFSINDHAIFLGPPKLLTNEIKRLLNSDKHYVIKPRWDNISLRRNNNIYHFNDQIQIKNDIMNYLKSLDNYSFSQ